MEAFLAGMPLRLHFPRTDSLLDVERRLARLDLLAERFTTADLDTLRLQHRYLTELAGLAPVTAVLMYQKWVVTLTCSYIQVGSCPAS